MKLITLTFTLTAALFAQTAQPPAPGSIAGRVTNSAGEPLARATINLRAQNTAPAQSIADLAGALAAITSAKAYSAESNAEGIFAFDALEPGVYGIQVQRNGYIVPSQALRQITVTTGQKITDLAITLLQQGVVSGRITDEFGEPYPQAQIGLYRRLYSKGRWMLQPMVQVVLARLASGPDGTFSIGSLEPGHYYVSADVPQQAAAAAMLGTPGTTPAQAESYTTTYFPNATETSLATAIEVSAGSQVSGINIRIQKVKAVRVRGKVVADGTPASGMITLIPTNGGLASIATRNLTIAQADGVFQFPQVTPGTYVLQSQSQLGALIGALGGNAAKEKPRVMVGKQMVNVTDRNMEDLVLQLGPGAEITGTIRAVDPASKGRPRVQLAGTDSTGLNGASAQALEDGTFTLKELAPGSYDVTVTGMPQGGYVKSVRYGGQDSTRKPVEVGTSGAALEILFATDGAETSGTVRDADGKAVLSAAVSLWQSGANPTDGSSRPAWNTTTDANGGFRFQNVPPGEYRVAAWTGLEQGLAESREFREQFAGSAEKVTLSANGHQSVDLKPVTRTAVDVAVAKLP